MNGLLSSRYDAPYPPSPEELNNACKKDQNVQCVINGTMCSRPLCNGATNMLSTPSSRNDDCEPLLSAVGSISMYLHVLIDKWIKTINGLTRSVIYFEWQQATVGHRIEVS